ncbi:MAG: aminopeptidase P family protein [Eubacteriaceae bacterium]|jgi:Xaa-Pro aminopeptidase|nr:aminopeptidase P family protein [Eubacteriaceae bacterium]
MNLEKEMSEVQRNDLLCGNDVDAVIITDPYNMRYMSAFAGEGCLYISKNKKVLITDSRYTEAAGKATSFDVAEEGRGSAVQSRFEIFRDCIADDKVKRLGYEDRSMLCSQFADFSAELKGVEFIPIGDSAGKMRRIKKPWEKECLAKAESIGDAAFSRILEIIRPGMTELETAAELEYAMRQNGGEGISFETIIASGIHSSMPHAVPTDKPLEEGDFITMDFGCKYQGYCSDMTRTIVLGKAADWQKEIYSIVLKANKAVIEKAHGGMTGKEIDTIARDIITDAGYGSCFGHSLGHGIGLFIHEEPNCNQRDERIIEAGMVESDEPGIYIPGRGGVRIEDMIYLTEDGLEVLSHSPKELIEL